MAHHIYTTSGIVVKSAPAGESNKFYRIFTRELGLVSATAQGVRQPLSKLRYSLQEYAMVEVSLVRGKEIWRITNAREEHMLYGVLSRTERLVVARIVSLVDRLVAGEEKHELLFDLISNAFRFLTGASLTKEELRGFELVTVLSILTSLGYGTNNRLLMEYIAMPFSPSVLAQVYTKEREAVEAINAALRESQL